MAPTMDPADVPEIRWARYPSSIRATTAPTRPIPLTPPPDSTMSAGLVSATAPTLHGVERRNQPGVIDLLQPHLDRTGREGTVRVLLAGGVLVDEHQHDGGIRMHLRHGGPHDGRGGLDGLLLGGRCDDLLGEVRVIRQEVARQMRFRSREILVEAFGRIRQHRDCAGLRGVERAIGGSIVDLPVSTVLTEVQPSGHAGRGKQRNRQHDGGHSPRQPARRSTLAPVALRHLFDGFVDGRFSFVDVGRGVGVLGGHGTNSTFDSLIWSPTRSRSTDSRHDRGSCLAPAALVTRELADTRTTAELSVIDSTPVALTVTSVTTFESSVTLMK